MSAPKKLLAAITANKIPTTPALTPNWSSRYETDGPNNDRAMPITNAT